MNKFEKLAKIEIAYQLIAQVHSELCNERLRKDVVAENALSLTRQILMFKSLVEKKIQDDTETEVANKTAHRLAENIRNSLFEYMANGKSEFKFDEVERIVVEMLEKMLEE